MSKSVLCAGRMYCDVIFTGAPRLPSPGTEVFAESVSLHAGGGAFITAATLSALGHKTALFAQLPAPPFDGTVAQELTEHRVDAQHCVRPEQGSEPQITVAMTCGADRAFLTRATGSALPDFDQGLPKGFCHLHIGELGTLEENPGLLEQARAQGMTISLDCGWQDAFERSAFELIAAVDVFLPNERELDALVSLGMDLNLPDLLVVKVGAEGAKAKRRLETKWASATATPVKVVDATGAGDAFNGGFISEWLRGRRLEDCLAQGNACGAASVQSVGGAGGLAKLGREFEAVASK